MNDSVRDQKTDHLITPANAALIVIDFQPLMVNAVNSTDRTRLVSNAVLVAKLSNQFGLPSVVTTVNASADSNNRLIPALRNEFCGKEIHDRTFINAWEDHGFRAAVKQTGRRKLVFMGLWTEACLTFPILDALSEGYEAYPLVDAIGGTSTLAHEAALGRMQQAGARLSSLTQFACELQRDWAREDTAEGIIGILREAGVFPRMD